MTPVDRGVVTVVLSSSWNPFDGTVWSIMRGEPLEIVQGTLQRLDFGLSRTFRVLRRLILTEPDTMEADIEPSLFF